MRLIIILILATLCLNFTSVAQPTLLETKVSLQYQEVALERVINELRKSYGVNFSYVNNLIPLHQKVTVNIKDQSLQTVLDELFKNMDVSYRVVGDQIVLKNEQKEIEQLNYNMKRPAHIPSIDGLVLLPEGSGPSDLYVGDVVIKPNQPDAKGYAFSDNMVAGIYRVVNELEKAVLTTSTKLETASSKISLNNSAGRPDKNTDEEKPELQANTDTVAVVESIIEQDTVIEKKDSTDQTQYIERPVQFTFVTPLGTNGIEAGKVVNTVSFNLLAGYAAALEGVEFGGLVNIEKDYVRGVQFAGFGNLVKNNVTGAQFAGFFNINGEAVRGAQFAGFINIAGEGSDAAQFAGFTNIIGGNVTGAQFAGFANITKGSVKGPQGAGFINVVGGDVTGFQAAGFTNVVKGDVNGVQVAGFLNRAQRVKGVQIGFINIADSVSGVQIGFLSFSREGYRKLEVWGSEALYANIGFKMGTRNFYNIFAVGGQTSGDYFRWGFGYGIGSEIGLGRNFALNIDAIAYHINEDEIWTNKLNLLNQLRTTIGIRLAGQSYFFFGPTFNVMVSQFAANDSEALGSGIAPSWTSYNKDHGRYERTNIKMWPGVNVGFRF